MKPTMKRREGVLADDDNLLPAETARPKTRRRKAKTITKEIKKQGPKSLKKKRGKMSFFV